MKTLIWLSLSVVGAAFFLTWALRRYALYYRVMDIPNARSSHSVPTPRGGGLAIVVSFSIGLLVFASMGQVDWNLVLALVGAGVIAATLGFFDDLSGLSARWRLCGHLIAAVWALWWLGGFPPVELAGFTLDFGVYGYLIGILYLTWTLNLYNFMDGIDGIASIEAVCVCVGGAVLSLTLNMPMLAIAPALLACAVIGFLFWNFPSARIFMGDVGSGFLGIVLGILSLQAAWGTPQLLWSWLILLGIFIVDATVTLFRRLFRGDKVYEAHRTHAYQYAARKSGKHLPVTLGVLIINVLWLYPIASLVAINWLPGILGVLMAYIPLCLLALILGAGKPERNSKVSAAHEG